MISGYVADEVRRGVRNQLRVPLVVMLIVLAVAACFGSYVLECIRGPFPTTLQQIAAMSKLGDAPHTFVRLKVDPSTLDPNAYHIHGGSDNKNDWYLFLHADGQRFLIVHNDSQILPDEIEGGLSDWKAWYAFNSDVAHDVVPNLHHMVQGEPLPLMLTTSYRMPFLVGLLICSMTLAFCAWQSWRDWRGRWDPARNRALRQLEKVGPLDEIALAIDAEVQAGSSQIEGLKVTRSWIIRPTYFGTDFLFMGDIAWAYRHDESTADEIKIGKGQGVGVVIVDLSGSRTIFGLPTEAADELLEDIARRVPWAVVGFDLELLVRWCNLKKEAFAFVAQRKREMEERTERT